MIPGQQKGNLRGMRESSCPVLYPSVILLAAGKSERMGTCKQLLDIGGKTAIQLCIENLLKAEFYDITVVTGCFHNEIEKSLSGYDVKFAVNDNKNSDMAESIRIGFKKTDIEKKQDSEISGIMIHLSDHPLVKPSTLKKIAEEYSISNDRIIIPVYNGRKGHPVVLPGYILRKIETGGTLRDLISAENARVKPAEVDDMGILFDMDTPDDYGKIKKMNLADILHNSLNGENINGNKN
jgi:molybdenum cofactor cytidylyltransferase